MSEEVFRLVIAAGVLLACIAFVVQAVVVILFYAAVGRAQRKIGEMGGRLEILSTKVEPLVDKVGPAIDQALPVISRISPMMDTVTQSLERMKPLIDGSAVVVGKIGRVVDKASPVVGEARTMVARVNEVIAEARPQIADLSEEAVAVVRTTRQQVERIGGVLHDATDRAQARLQQIDTSLEQTVGQVGQVGESMKRAVMRPVREANGLAAGISAAVSTLVRPRKAPDSATQDEEMFI